MTDAILLDTHIALWLDSGSDCPRPSTRDLIDACWRDGGTILVSAVTVYWEFFTSVWCFFAATASIVILGHFEHARRHRRRLAGAW